MVRSDSDNSGSSNNSAPKQHIISDCRVPTVSSENDEYDLGKEQNPQFDRNSLVERAKVFDPKFKDSFNEDKFGTLTEGKMRRTSAVIPDQDDIAFHFVSPTLTEVRQRNMEEHIQRKRREEPNLLLPAAPIVSTEQPKKYTAGPLMKAMLDASIHRGDGNYKTRTYVSTSNYIKLPVLKQLPKLLVENPDAPPPPFACIKLRNVCAPKLSVDIKTFQAPKHPKTEWQTNLIVKAIKESFLLRENIKTPQIQDHLVEAMEPVDLKRGAILHSEGDVGEDNFYIVQDGKIELQINNKTVETVTPGKAFGQERLLLCVPNQTTVRAVEPSTLLRLDQTTFRAIMQQQHEKSDPPPPSPAPMTKLWEEEPVADQAPVGPTQVLKSTDEIQLKRTLSAPLMPVQKQETASEPPPRRKSQGATPKKHSKTKVKKMVQKVIKKIIRRKKAKTIPPYDDSTLMKSAIYQQQLALRKAVQQHANSKDDLEFIRVLGEGQFGEVWLVAANLPEPSGRQEFALKIQHLEDDIREDDAEDAIRAEIDVLNQLRHPFMVNLVHVYETEESIDMLLGLIRGGELWEEIHRQADDGNWISGMLPEYKAKFYSYIVADTLTFLHSKKYLFRDLKPENIMIDQDGYPILIDFGFAKKVPAGSKTFTFCGTPNYVAPEIIQTVGHSVGADHWALGIVIYEMLAGENPFFYEGMEQFELYQAIADEEPYPLKEGVGTNLMRDLIDKLLKKDPSERLGFRGGQEILMHPWYDGMPDLNKIRSKQVKVPTCDADLIIEEWEEVEIEEIVEVEVPDLNLEPSTDKSEEVIISPKPSIFSKTFITPTQKGTLKGYFVSPQTKDQRRNSQDRRSMVKGFLDNLGLEDEKDFGKIEKPGLRKDSNLGNYSFSTPDGSEWNKVSINNKGNDGKSFYKFD